MSDITPMTATELLASVSDTLGGGGYRRVAESVLKDWPIANFRVFEDQYGVVGVVVYETWNDLSSNWVDAQAALVELMSRHMTSSDAKSWDGYLILLTPSTVEPSSGTRAADIRYDTTRLRKLVATGDQLQTPSDVERILLPLLPLATESRFDIGQTALQLLPKFLSQAGIQEDAVMVLVKAFHENAPMMERLHAYRSQQ